MQNLRRIIPGYFRMRHIKNIFFCKEAEYKIIWKKFRTYDGYIDVDANLDMYTYFMNNKEMPLEHIPSTEQIKALNDGSPKINNFSFSKPKNIRE